MLMEACYVSYAQMSDSSKKTKHSEDARACRVGKHFQFNLDAREVVFRSSELC
jgi:hypothetical protein